MHLTPETSERLTAGVARLTRTARQLGHRVTADLPSSPAAPNASPGEPA